MKIILEHLKAQTVPHDILEELTGCGVKFYEGIRDYMCSWCDAR